MMAYQLGGQGLNGFTKTRTHIERNEFKAASVEMLNSRWAEQTYQRAERAADMFYLDKWL
jgi:hypothetical protein